MYVVNKRDQLWEDGKTMEELQTAKTKDIQNTLNANVKVIFTSCKDNYGLDELINAINEILAPSKQDRWHRGAKAYSKKFLDEKRSVCEKRIVIASLASAANGVNPVIGLNTSVDIEIIVALFNDIARTYGLNNEFLNILTSNADSQIGRLASVVIRYITKDGVMILLKSFAGRLAISAFAKYIPVIGLVISSSLGYLLVSNAGKAFLDSCHELATKILEKGILDNQ